MEALSFIVGAVGTIVGIAGLTVGIVQGHNAVRVQRIRQKMLVALLLETIALRTAAAASGLADLELRAQHLYEQLTFNFVSADQRLSDEELIGYTEDGLITPADLPSWRALVRPDRSLTPRWSLKRDPDVEAIAREVRQTVEELPRVEIAASQPGKQKEGEVVK